MELAAQVLEERKLASMNITRNIFSDLSILVPTSIDWSNITDLCYIAHLCSQANMNAEAEAMYLRALRGFEKAASTTVASISF